MHHLNHHRAIRRSLVSGALLATAAVPAWASANSTSGLCTSGDRGATPAQIETTATDGIARLGADLTWMRTELVAATAGSPAQFRLREEVDLTDLEARKLQELQYTAVIRADATSGSPAEFRAQEELDDLCANSGVAGGGGPTQRD